MTHASDRQPAAGRPHAKAGTGSARANGTRGGKGKIRTGYLALLAGAGLASYCLVLVADRPPGSLLTASTLSQAPAAPDKGTAARVKENDLALYLARSTLMALDNANRTGNYAVLRALAAPAFQRVNSTERLAQVFQPQRRAHLDLSVAAIDEPSWTTPPAVGPDNRLRLAGRYRSAGGEFRFTLGFAASAGAWRLDEIHVAPRLQQQISAVPAGKR